MENILYEVPAMQLLPAEVQKRRLQYVVDHVLTSRQRQVVIGYYWEKKSKSCLARELGVHKSTVGRTLARAEESLRRYLRY